VIIGEAGVRLRPEASTFGREAEAEVDGKLPGVAKKAAGYFALAFAAVGVGAFLKDAIGRASDLGESASKVGVVFGDSADEVKAFAATASTSLGITEAQALEATGTFGNLLRSVGLTSDESAEMSTSMVQLASDLASFNNTDPTEALDALRSGLVGETEPLKRFGINMNEAALSAKAVELGLADQGEQLDAQSKAAAAYALIMEQTSLAQGDFARTSAGLANQQRIITAQFGDLSANVGGLFVPVVGMAAGLVSGSLMPALLNLTDNLPAIGNALGSVGDYFRLGFSDGLDAVFDANTELAGTARWIMVVAANAGDLAAIFREAFVDGAAGSANLGAAGLVGFAVTAGDAARQIADSFSGVWGGLVDTLGPVLAQVQAALGPAVAAISAVFADAFGGGGGGGLAGALSGIAGLVSTVLETIGPMIATYVGRYAEIFMALLPGIVAVVEAVVPLVVDLFGQIGPVLAALMPVLAAVAQALTGALVEAIGAVVAVLPVLLPVLGQIVQLLAGAFLGVIEALLPVLPVLAQALAGIAQALIGGLLTVLQALMPILPPLVEAIAGIAVVIAEVLGAALAAIAPMLPTIIDAFVQLLMLALVPLLPIIPLLAQLVLMLLTALAPLIPPILQIAALLVQLAITALMPILPIIPQLVGLIGMLVTAFMPVIQIVATVIGAFAGLVANVVGFVVGLVSNIGSLLGDLIGFFVSLPGKILSAIGSLGGLLLDAGGDLIQGLVDGIAGAAKFVGDIGRNVANAVIGFINDKIIDGLNGLLEFEIAGISVDVPDIPHIPTFHEGGVTAFGGAGEGLALLRNDELVATPEQRQVADNLLRALLAGDLPTPGRDAGTAAPGSVTIHEHIHAVPGESAGTIAARASAAVVWNLNNGIGRRVGADALEPALR